MIINELDLEEWPANFSSIIIALDAKKSLILLRFKAPSHSTLTLSGQFLMPK
jgi:hypothetical protein